MANVAGPVEMVVQNHALGVGRVVRSRTPPRPNTLFLEARPRGNNPSSSMVHDSDKNNNMPSSESRPISMTKRKKKRRPANAAAKKFEELYVPTGETLGEGSTGSVQTYRNVMKNQEFAVKIIKKTYEKTRNKVLKEIEIFHHCRGHPNILQLVEYFEEEDRFYMIFEKMEGGTLLETIENRGHLTEQEASMVVQDIAKALDFLHKKGIAHRDLKPENILCVKVGQLTPVKICDFDLGSGVIVRSNHASPVTTPELSTPVGSAEFMAPEVVDVWQDQAWKYDKRCDIWSLGIILYIMLCGYPPFYGCCGQNCGWEHGEACDTCQDQLFTNIQDGDYKFPPDEWEEVSEEAKDLISHLLVRDPVMRYSATEVLRHIWVTMESPKAQLATPRVLHRNNSIKELEAFAESAIAVNRMILRHLSISEAHEPSVFRPWEDFEESSGEGSSGGGREPIFSMPGERREPIFSMPGERREPIFSMPGERREPIFSMPGDRDDPIFHVGSDSEDEMFQISGDEAAPDVAPVLWMGLSPPGESSLARRRAKKSSSESSGSDSTVGSPRTQGRSPTKSPSAMF